MIRAWLMRLRYGRDPRQARYLTPQSLRWVVHHRAFTPYYLLRYWRLFVLRVRHPDIVTTGMVFLGRNVELATRPGFGRSTCYHYNNRAERFRISRVWAIRRRTSSGVDRRIGKTESKSSQIRSTPGRSRKKTRKSNQIRSRPRR